MEDILGSSLGSNLNSSEEIMLGDQLKTYDQILRNAHNLLIPNKRYAYDVVNECNMIKVAIRDLVRSEKSEAEKYAILLQLAADSRLQINPQFSLWEIGSAIQDYYMNTCLNIDPTVTSKLSLLWGLGIKQQVTEYSAYCRSIQQKMEQAYSFNWGVPRHVITMLYDPEIGIIATQEWKQRAPQNYVTSVTATYGQIFDLVWQEQRRLSDLPRLIEGTKMHAADVIVWKINAPQYYRDTYDNYEEDAQRNGLTLAEYVSRDPEVTKAEADFFRNYHKTNNVGTPYRFNPIDTMNALNENMKMTYEERIERGNENVPPLTQITLDEAKFIVEVQRQFIGGEYPIDMLWEDICKQYD